ncbi:hypothetical protein OYT88_06410 [Sporolactobacillus sp. CQH2019]|uniref:hypothetical protein n=1 Tax=Sporolactobacillus sp. CQH2019 TaxID=3023512 RepID=UPI002367D162|nr:hypothetical protein [Sporolactobacillus sp. CQH2019]MDD9148179.1 hypothetical protein [Sporolactobacillus sp. CQH2019]
MTYLFEQLPNIKKVTDEAVHFFHGSKHAKLVQNDLILFKKKATKSPIKSAFSSGFHLEILSDVPQAEMAETADQSSSAACLSAVSDPIDKFTSHLLLKKENHLRACLTLASGSLK